MITVACRECGRTQELVEDVSWACRHCQTWHASRETQQAWEAYIVKPEDEAKFATEFLNQFRTDPHAFFPVVSTIVKPFTKGQTAKILEGPDLVAVMEAMRLDENVALILEHPEGAVLVEIRIQTIRRYRGLLEIHGRFTPDGDEDTIAVVWDHDKATGQIISELRT